MNWIIEEEEKFNETLLSISEDIDKISWNYQKYLKEELEFSKVVSTKIESISKEINQLSLHYQNNLKSLKEEFQVCKAMVEQESIVSSCFHEFHTSYTQKSAQILDPESEPAVAITAVNQKALDISNIMTTYEDATIEAIIQLKELAENLKLTVRSLRLAQEQCFHSTSVEQLEGFDPLEFDTYATLYVLVTDLNRQWDEEDLPAQVKQCLETLRGI